MTLIRDFGKWMAAVFKEWYGWVGASATAGLVGFGQGIGWWGSPGKRIYISLLVIGFIISTFGAWRDEHIAAEKAKRKVYDGRPRISLEAAPYSGAEWKTADYIFWIQNVGDRAAREIRFAPIQSRSGKWCLRLDTVGTLIPKHRPPLGFAVDCNEMEMPKDGLNYYLRHFCGDGSPDSKEVFRYPITATLYDVNDKMYTEEWELECTMPAMLLKITPQAAQLPLPPENRHLDE